MSNPKPCTSCGVLTNEVNEYENPECETCQEPFYEDGSEFDGFGKQYDEYDYDEDDDYGDYEDPEN